MKNWKKLALALGVLVSVTTWKTDAAQAKSLPYDKVYAVDLDGDGTKEKVKFTSKSSDNYPFFATANLFINGKKVYSEKVTNALTAGADVVDFDKEDNKKDIYVQFTAESDCFVKAKSWQYTGKKLTKRFQVTGKDLNCIRLGIQQKQPGDGKVYLEEEYSDTYAGQGFVQGVFSIKSGTLKPVDGKILNVTNNWKKKTYTATGKLSVYETSNASKKKFTIKKGEVFSVEKIKLKKKNCPIDGISNLYVKTKKGKSGWIKVPKKAFFKESYAWG